MEIRNLLKIRNFTPPFLLALAACSGEVDNPLANGPVALGVTAEIGQVMSRAAGTSFETNDVIGVIPEQAITDGGGAAQYQFGYAADGFAAQGTQYYFADTNEKTFHAYYPYTAAVSQNAAITLDTRAANQVVEQLDEQRTWRMNDYLAATATASASKPTASYTGSNAFRHVMAQVVLKFQTGGGLSGLSPLTSYTLTTPLAMDGTFSPASGAVTVDEAKDKETLTISNLTAAEDGTKSSTLLLLPQSVADGQLGLDVTYNNQTYRAALSLPNTGTEAATTPALTAGTSYAYTVTISQSGLSVGEAQIQEWNTVEKDVEALPAPPLVKKPLTEAAVGDFYFSDGTIADKSAKLTTEQADACVGIVFAVGQNSTDETDYSTTGIKREECHGYVVALTDAHENIEGLSWLDPGVLRADISDISDKEDDWQGYANTQAIRAYAELNHKDEEAQTFPAAYACLQYGTKDGPEWTRRFAAPSSSSDWFLPSGGQLAYLNVWRKEMQACFDGLTAVLSETGHVGWFQGIYWSSTYKFSWNPEDGTITKPMMFFMNEGIKGFDYPDQYCRVRPILAF